MGRSRRSRASRRVRGWVVTGLAVVGLAVALVKQVVDEGLIAGAGWSDERLGTAQQRSAAFATSLAACEESLPERDSPDHAVASWNLKWFPYGTAPERERAGRETDVRWMACVMAHLQADVIAVQEVLNDARGKAALKRLLAQLDELTSGRHKIVLDECSDRAQHVGFIYDSKRVSLLEHHVETSLNPSKQACGWRLRPGVSARFRFADAEGDVDEVELIVVHLDSGVTMRDHRNRLRSLENLRELVAASEEPTLVIGDFNTMGSESASTQESSEQECKLLEERSGLVHLTPRFSCTHYYHGQAVELDHALATRSLAKTLQVESLGPCAARKCEKLGRAFSDYVHRVSDHCPLKVSFEHQAAAPSGH